MDINDVVTQFKNNTLVVEDVYADYSLDGTYADITVCGPYGKELCTCTLSIAELDALKDDLNISEFAEY